MIETSKDTSKSDREKGIYVRCRTTQPPQASTIQSFQRGNSIAIKISGHNHPVSEVKVDLTELKPLRFEYLVEPPDKFREEVLHPPKEK